MRLRRTIIVLAAGIALVPTQSVAVDLSSVPLVVTSQTLTVRSSNFLPNQEETVIGGNSVAHSWNFGSEHGSTTGSVSSTVTDGELILTIDTTVAKGGTTPPNNVGVNIGLVFSFEIAAPDLGGVTTPVYFQFTRMSSNLTGAIEGPYFSLIPDDQEFDFSYRVQSETFGTSVLADKFSILQPGGALPNPGLDLIFPMDFFPGDTVTLTWREEWNTSVRVENESGSALETYRIRALTPTPLPEPSASLVIPSGVGMLIALAKLRGVSLIR